MNLIEKYLKSLEKLAEPNERHFKKMIKDIGNCKNEYDLFGSRYHGLSIGIGTGTGARYLHLIIQKYPEKLDELFMTNTLGDNLFSLMFERLYARSNTKTKTKTSKLFFEILRQLSHENQELLLNKIDWSSGEEIDDDSSSDDNDREVTRSVFLLYFNLILSQHRDTLLPTLITKKFLFDVLSNKSLNTLKTVLEAASAYQPKSLLQALLVTSEKYFDRSKGEFTYCKQGGAINTRGNILHFLAEMYSLEHLVDLLRQLETQYGRALPSEVFTDKNAPYGSNLGIIAAGNKKSPDAFLLVGKLLEELPSKLLEQVVEHKNAAKTNLLQALAMNQSFAVFFEFVQMLNDKIPDSLLDIFQKKKGLIGSMVDAYRAEDFYQFVEFFKVANRDMFEFLIDEPAFLGKVASFYPDLALDFFCHSIIEKNNLDAVYKMAYAGYTPEYNAFRDQFCSRLHTNEQLLQYQTAFYGLLERKHLIEPEYQNFLHLFTLDTNDKIEFIPVPESLRRDLSKCCKLVLAILGKKEEAKETAKAVSALASLSFMSASSQKDQHDKLPFKQVNKILSEVKNDFILLRNHALVNPDVSDNLLHLASWKALDFQAQSNLLDMLEEVKNASAMERAGAQMILQFQGQLEDSKKEIRELKTEIQVIKEQSASILELLTSLSDKLCQDENNSAARL